MNEFIVRPDGKMPEAQTEFSAGYDCFAREVEYLVYPDGTYIKYRLGFSVVLDPSNYGLLVPRSSIYKQGLSCANSAGIIDPDYKDEVCFVARKHDVESDFEYAVGERCCQFILMPRLTMKNGNRKSANRNGGFGSTGT